MGFFFYCFIVEIDFMDTTSFRMDFVSDNAIQIRFLTNHLPDFNKVASNLKRFKETVISEVCFAYDTFTVFFNPLTTDVHKLKEILIDEIMRVIEGEDSTSSTVGGRLFEIPVCFCEDCALDKKRIEDLSGKKFDDFVKEYVSVIYRVLFIGFQPGFPFLGGLPVHLQLPRLQTPRIKVPAGSLGIGGKQTGIYVFSTPGGWNIIGRTNFKLFDFSKGAVLQAGDRISFQISNCK
jgi:KipI family sensor histidine kinase inhibitor